MVRAKFAEFRRCYDRGLARDPNLTGRVEARFVIGKDGKVTNVGVFGKPSGEDAALQERRVIACLERNFATLSFPPPKGGIVTVSYPIVFHSGAKPRCPSGRTWDGMNCVALITAENSSTKRTGSGTRSRPATIQGVVRAKFAVFRRCYERGLARDPNLTGRVEVRFVIGKNGKATNVEVLGKPTSCYAALQERQVIACLERSFATLSFPPPKSGHTVSYPIVFHPGPKSSCP